MEEPDGVSDAIVSGCDILTLNHHGHSSARPLDQCLDEQTSLRPMAGSSNRATAASCTRTSICLIKVSRVHDEIAKVSLTRSLEPLQQKQ